MPSFLFSLSPLNRFFVSFPFGFSCFYCLRLFFGFSFHVSFQPFSFCSFFRRFPASFSLTFCLIFFFLCIYSFFSDFLLCICFPSFLPSFLFSLSPLNRFFVYFPFGFSCFYYLLLFFGFSFHVSFQPFSFSSIFLFSLFSHISSAFQYFLSVFLLFFSSVYLFFLIFLAVFFAVSFSFYFLSFFSHFLLSLISLVVSLSFLS